MPHANHATRSRLPLHSRAVTIFLIDLLFGVSYLFLHVLYRRLDTFFSDCDDSFFAKRGAVVVRDSGRRSGFDPVAVWLCRARVVDSHLCLLISPIIVL